MKPLKGVRVLEIASIGPGPLAAQTFLELGAEVIRVNNPHSLDLLPKNTDPSLPLSSSSPVSTLMRLLVFLSLRSKF